MFKIELTALRCCFFKSLKPKPDKEIFYVVASEAYLVCPVLLPKGIAARVVVCCSVLQCVACVAVCCCSALQWILVCCSVLQCVAVCCSYPFRALVRLIRSESSCFELFNNVAAMCWRIDRIWISLCGNLFMSFSQLSVSVKRKSNVLRDSLTVTSVRAIARVSHIILICYEYCVK